MKHENPHLTRHLSVDDQNKFWDFGIGPKQSAPYENIHKAFEQQARIRPQAMAVSHLKDTISYGLLNEKAEALASELATLGCCRGKNVGLFLERSIPMVIGIMAVLKTGAAYVPQDARITPVGQLQHIIENADIKVILTLSHLKHRIPMAKGVKVIALDELLLQLKTDLTNGSLKLERKSESNGSCFILYTSGTSGFPNGVEVTHQNVCNIILTAPGNLGIQPGQSVSQILNISFDMAAWEIFSALSHGATLVIRGKSIAEVISQVNVVIATPSVLMTIDHEVNPQVKVVAVAGEPCPKNLAEKWSKYAKFYNCCGPTETTIVNTMKLYETTEGRISIGRPTPNNTVYILDDKIKPVPIGEIGEMWAGGLCVSQGYIKNSILTNERYKLDPFLGGDHIMFRTRDLGRWNQDGELEHFGRTDDQVKIKGFRVELDSISTVLESIPGCEQAVTIKLDSYNLVSFIQSVNADVPAAMDLLREKLPYYSVPSLIIPLGEFPKTERGKIDKKSMTVLAVSVQEESEGEPGQLKEGVSL